MCEHCVPKGGGETRIVVYPTIGFEFLKMRFGIEAIVYDASFNPILKVGSLLCTSQRDDARVQRKVGLACLLSLEPDNPFDVVTIESFVPQAQFFFGWRGRNCNMLRDSDRC